MFRLTRKFTLAVLLALLVSQAALNAHVATHLSAERVVCELCAANSDGFTPVATAGHLLLLPAVSLERSAFLSLVAVARRVRIVQPRGPPLFN